MTLITFIAVVGYSDVQSVYFCCAGLNKWVEVGNSGVFRPEMLLPMGLPRDVSVIAWGLSLERYAVVDVA